MKPTEKKPRKRFNKFTIGLLVIAVALFGVNAWLDRPEKQETLTAKEEKEIDEQIEDTESKTTNDELSEEDLAAAQEAIDSVENEEEESPYEDPDTYVTDEQKQVYAAFQPQLQAFSDKYDSTWDELWMPAFDLAPADPDGAINLLATLSAAYESYGEQLRALEFPPELDETDASDFDLATDRFAEAMAERQKAAIFAGAAIRQGTLTDDTTIGFIKSASDRADSKLIDAAATFYDLNTKYGYTQ